MIALVLLSTCAALQDAGSLAKTVITVADEELRLALTDVDGDGGLDLVFLEDGGLAVRYLRADGTYAAEHDALLPWPSEQLAWTLVDADGDGSTEFALLLDGREIRLYSPAEDGSLGEGEVWLEARAALPRGIYRMRFLRDIDGDGLVDAVLPVYDHYAIHRRAAGGTWMVPLEVQLQADIDHDVGDPTELDSSFGQRVDIPWFSLEDVDGDGDPDLVAETDDAVYFHLATPELSGSPTWVLDLEALRNELPEDDGIDFDDLLAQGGNRTAWRIADLDGVEPNDLVVQVGPKFRTYLGGSVTGPVGAPDQVLKSSGTVLYFFLRDVQGDGGADLQLIRSERLSLSRVLRWLIIPGDLDFEIYTYENTDGAFSRRPTRQNTLRLEFPRLLSFVKRMEEMEERMEAQELVPATRVALDPDGVRDDVVDIQGDELVVFLGLAPEDEAAMCAVEGDDTDAYFDAYMQAAIDGLDDGGTKTIDLGAVDEWMIMVGGGLREACAGHEPDRRILLPAVLTEATIDVRDLDGDGVLDYLVTGRDEAGQKLVVFMVDR